MKRRLAVSVVIVGTVICSPQVWAAKKKPDQATDKAQPAMSAETFKGLTLRSLGPALRSGRIVDFAVDPEDRSRYFVASASGGVWKTTNAGTTWTPIFDNEGSYSIGCITIDPKNPSVLWVGTGENNSQRSVSFGDGVYKSLDGGQTWKRMGLESSEHIGMIAIDPRDSDVIYVAAQGPLWASGGDRGLYKSTDGGQTWKRALDISPDTGINEVILHPGDPDVIYASSYQRRRRVWTLINGGPESAIHKSTDGGATWRQLKKGLPEVDMGRIGMCVPPAEPDTIYAIVEAAHDKGGVFRSTDRGESWVKRSDYRTQSPQYYNELVCDPSDADRVYALDTRLHVSINGGTAFTKVSEDHKHVDNHAMWIDPGDPDFLLVGCDGGVYESHDRGATWSFRENLPITQFYRVAVDRSRPFYYVYGGTQDNGSLGGPSRTLNISGISNEDWFVTVGGDGYQTVADPADPSTVYSEWQYGGLVRYDRSSGELVDIQPQEAPGEDAHRWNWDSPLMISPHSPTRLYVACQRVYRSDDRGNSWRPVSGDLSRGLDRDQLEVMGTLWSIDAVSKNMSTSDYGNVVALTESPLVEDLLYAGTDDGLIQITENGGETWRTVERVPGVPEMTYVSRLQASLHDPDTVYAAFDNHKSGDFKPYVAVSRDRGHTWASIAGDLPEREIVYALAQDHVNPKLLFAGTELGLSFTVDEGAHWIRLKGGLPTIAVRDLDIQRQECDLAVGTFGRGIYLLDDYSMLRQVNEAALGQEAVLFPVKDALLYIQKRSRQMARGHGFFTAANPPFGTTFTYYLRDGLKTKKELRLEAEKEARTGGERLRIPSFDELAAEEREVEPEILLIVRDPDGAIVDRVEGPRGKGLHRVTWDLREPSASPTKLEEDPLEPWQLPDRGPLVAPGAYTVTLARTINGEISELSPAVTFQVAPLALSRFGADDPEALRVFRARARSLYRAVQGASKVAGEATERIKYLRKALVDTPDADPTLMAELERLHVALADLKVALEGDTTREKRNVFTPPSIIDRVNRIRSDQWSTTQPPTATHLQSYEWAADAFERTLADLKSLLADLAGVETRLESAQGPWTPGRVPEWKRD